MLLVCSRTARFASMLAVFSLLSGCGDDPAVAERNGNTNRIGGDPDTNFSTNQNDNTNANANSSDNAMGVPGCTNPDAENYDPDATVDDGSCVVPFTWSLGPPLGTEVPDLGTVAHPLTPLALWETSAAPLPTNAWWMNLALGSQGFTVNAMPHLVRAFSDRLQVSRQNLAEIPIAIFATFSAQIELRAVESFSASPRIVDYDLLSVILQWTSTSGTMTTPLVRGSPYITAEYDGLTPRLSSAETITALNGSGSRYGAVLSGGDTYILYFSSAVELSLSAGELEATAPFTGTLRVARLTNEAVLDAHSGAIPFGGAIEASIEEGVAQVRFNWERGGTGPLLMMSLPHHRDSFVGATLTALSERTLRGDMVGVSGDDWTMEMALPDLGVQAPRPIDPSSLAEISSALASEKGIRPTATDTYFFGTQVGTMTRLLLIAEALGDEPTAGELTEALKAELAPWIAGTNADPLVYDTVWGGVVPAAAAFDSGAQFGSGYYNDHHFHYGYHLYAAAAVARRDPTWAAANGEFYRTLARDFMNPSLADPHFPQFRSFDWFVGHSWAAGLFQFADGRNQESTSEAVHAYYAAKLFGEATNDDNLRGLGWLLAAMEIQSTQRYWQMKDPSEIYFDSFAANGVVGILWSLKAAHETFFGNNTEFIFGIQVLPITPATEPLIDPLWAESVWPIAATSLTRANPPIDNDWRLVMAALRGTHDVDDAATLLVNPSGLGRSRTNLLWWLATRP